MCWIYQRLESINIVPTKYVVKVPIVKTASTMVKLQFAWNGFVSLTVL